MVFRVESCLVPSSHVLSVLFSIVITSPGEKRACLYVSCTSVFCFSFFFFIYATVFVLFLLVLLVKWTFSLQLGRH